MQKYEKEHRDRVREIAPECMVLLKSDGSFPLKSAGKIALFGNGARHTIKGGTGSGDVNVRSYSTVEEGLNNAGFSITSDEWMDGYEKIWEQAHKAFVAAIKNQIRKEGISAILTGLGAVMPEPEYELPLEGEGNTAVYVLARVSGEGSDRQVVAGDFKLNKTEIHDIRTLAETYEKFLLVLNVGGVVDLMPVAEYVPNILLLSQLGSMTGDAFADVLLGKSYPSGRLAATWAGWDDYCHEGDFARLDDTRYREGIYVGYRYFDTIRKEPLFPFGFGLGYTDFGIKVGDFTVKGTNVTVTAEVINKGAHRGKEVLQLYVSIPEGKLDQPYQVLAGFTKTGELKSGASQKVSISFKMEELASFDEETAARILEAGDYLLRLGRNSRDTELVGAIRMEESVVTETLTHVGGVPDFEDWKPVVRRPEVQVVDVPVRDIPRSAFVKKEHQRPSINPKALDIVKKLSGEELAYLCTGNFVEEGSGSVIGNAAVHVAGAAGETTGRFEREGILPLIMADGPAGLRLSPKYGIDENGIYSMDGGSMEAVYEFVPEEMLAMLGIDGKEQNERQGQICEQYCTAIPIGTAIAQSWSTTVSQACGDIVGAEMERFGIHLWLAPALNIHRLPLCGRNFEYYSEDPLISGRIAAEITKGIQQHHGCGVTVKHFVCNNQETNRFHSNSVVSERALRDIYMKGFEIVIKEAEPHTVMSSYNLLNGEHTSQRKDLLETVLRDEWGFAGIVMSDWISGNLKAVDKKYPGACAHGAIKAGNDIMMPGTRLHYDNLVQAIYNEESDYPIGRAELEKCAARMIETSWKLRQSDEKRV